jgi:hypothetical protein
MMRLITFVLMLGTSHSILGQPSAGQCYYSTKGGIARSRLIILPLTGNDYVIEIYRYGMGMFWGLPFNDTLVFENKVFRSEKHEITIKGKKLKIETVDAKRTFKFSILHSCDPEINWTRNWTYREIDRYKIKDEEKSREFWKNSDPFLRILCHNEFLARMTEIKNDLGVKE